LKNSQTKKKRKAQTETQTFPILPNLPHAKKKEKQTNKHQNSQTPKLPDSKKQKNKKPKIVNFIKCINKKHDGAMHHVSRLESPR
jgi:hypothetical protein